MRFRNETRSVPLNAAGIDGFSDWLDERLSAGKTDRRAGLRVRLTAEEILLRLRERCGEDAAVSASLELSRIRPTLRLEWDGAPFNPLNETADALGDWNSSLMTAVGLNSKYVCSWGRNQLRIPLPARRLNEVLRFALLLGLGALCGVAGRFLLPQDFLQALPDTAQSVVFEVWSRVLNAISGPVIFFMVITTMLNTRQIKLQGGSRTHVLVRYFGISTLLTSAAVMLCFPVFSLRLSGFRADTTPLREATDYLLRLIPKNVVSPFAEADTPQLLLIASVIGAALILLGDRAETLRSMLRQVNMIGLQVSRWISRLAPVFCGIFLCMEIWNGRTNLLLAMWKPLTFSLLFSAAVMALGFLFFTARLRLRPLPVLRELSRPFLLALRTASLDEAFEEAERGCIRGLGADAAFARVSLPQGLVLYMPVSAVGTLVFTVFTAQVYGVSSDPVWLVSVVLFAVLLFVATPPVPGANLLAYAVFFSWLGIPGGALIIAMLFDVIFGVFAAAGNLTMLQMETVLQAQKLGLRAAAPVAASARK